MIAVSVAKARRCAGIRHRDSDLARLGPVGEIELAGLDPSNELAPDARLKGQGQAVAVLRVAHADDHRRSGYLDAVAVRHLSRADGYSAVLRLIDAWPEYVADLMLVQCLALEQGTGNGMEFVDLSKLPVPKDVLDLVPVKEVPRPQMMRSLCAIHDFRGDEYDIGLGFYSGHRFHVDSKGFRRWGSNGRSATSPCNTHIFS